ncbi:hypothetical protein H1W37_06420 [Stappia taiwanensis]|uniref:Uncharacterized protein n=1 Tax=Stappia taiwanensis TaxID=992267 RepID=A0A838XRU5_9HYPH|nr:hypothetical protein [Stappia taiwanensis]MBA4611276.1 hypothetical protein [Stappia taiwanensis]GGE87320.1 hypothetical protein GCM10007285_13680 [Stappia taiwanensis]
MFDITTVREIDYGSDQVAYVYQDHDDPKLWYMVPVPTLRRVNGAPAFSLTSYTKNGGGIAGLCTFEMELIQPTEARRAAEEVLGDDISWGGFTWVGGTAFFYYDIEGEAEVLAVEPTLYGTNVAAFQVPLKTAAAVNTFKNAYSQGGGASPFRVEYDMQVLTMLLGAKATVKYVAEAAIEYQKTYKTVRDTWGNQKKVLQEVKQVMQQSGAGEVKVTLGAGSSPELEQRVRDWGWTTLENQVANTIAAAAAMATGPDPVSATTSFEQTYEEDTVIDWSTPVSTFMRKFSAEEWSKLFVEVDNRKLSVVFNLIGQLSRTSDGGAVAQSITVTVDYPTRKTDNTFTLIVTDGDQSSQIYEAPGDFSGGAYNPQFTYSYVILFEDGKTYESEPVTTTDTLINLTPNNFGVRQVTFIGQDVPFTAVTGVKSVDIDFFFAPPLGNPAIVQTKTMTANGEANAITFDSYYDLPIGQAYTYRLRYVMDDGSVIVSQPPGALSSSPDNTNSGNADIVFVSDPKGLFTQFTVRAFNYPGKPADLLLVDVTAQYFDPANDGDKALFQNTWSNWQPSGLLSFAEPRWNFQAVDNMNTAYFNISGTIFYSDGKSFMLDNYKQSSEYKTLTISNTVENYSVKVDIGQIDWDKVANVNLTMFQLSDEARERFGDTLPRFLTKPREEMTSEERALAAGSQENLILFNVLGPGQGTPTDQLERYYGIQRERSEPTVEFYYTAIYVMKDGSAPRELVDQKVEGRLSVELPALPPASVAGGIVRQVIDPEALAARTRAAE